MTRVNLLPWREQLREEKRREFLVMLGAAAGAALLLVVVVHSLLGAAISVQYARNNYLKQEISGLDVTIRTIQDLKKQKADLISRMQIIQELQLNRAQVVHLFDEIVKILPPGVYFSSIERSGAEIVLLGKAESNTNVSALMRNIGRSFWLGDAALSEIKSDSGAGDAIGESDFKLQVVQRDPYGLKSKILSAGNSDKDNQQGKERESKQKGKRKS